MIKNFSEIRNTEVAVEEELYAKAGVDKNSASDVLKEMFRNKVKEEVAKERDEFLRSLYTNITGGYGSYGSVRDYQERKDGSVIFYLSNTLIIIPREIVSSEDALAEASAIFAAKKGRKNLEQENKDIIANLLEEDCTLEVLREINKKLKELKVYVDKYAANLPETEFNPDKELLQKL